VLPADIDYFIEHGVTCVLGKPLKLDTLKNAIKDHVAGVSLQKAAPQGSPIMAFSS
jgi:hypothetical protein